MPIRSNNSKRGRAAEALSAANAASTAKRQRGSKAAVIPGQRTLTMAGSINTKSARNLPPVILPVPTAEAAADVAELEHEKMTAIVTNTKADATRLNTVAADLSACMTQHGLLLNTVEKAAMQPEDPIQRQKLLRELTTEFATANRPLLELNIYQRELSATLNFSGQYDPRTISANKLHVIPLKMELMFMRAANTSLGERACRSGDKCDNRRISKRLGKKPWTMQEFLMPPDQEQLASSNELPIQAQLCLMCMKKNVYMHYAQSLYQDTDAKVVIQPYQSKCGVEGEFDESVILKPPTDRFFGIVAPFVRHDVTMYTMEVDPITNLPFAAFTDAVYFRLPPVEHA